MSESVVPAVVGPQELGPEPEIPTPSDLRPEASRPYQEPLLEIVNGSEDAGPDQPQPDAPEPPPDTAEAARIDTSQESLERADDGNSDAPAPDSSESPDDTLTPKTSRELKSILALSKEAKLDTNISTQRRKTLDRARSSTPKKNKMTAFPVTAESELEIFDVKVDEKKAPKKRKLSGGGVDSGAEGATGEELKRGVQGISGDFIMPRKPNKDVFCWRCHHDSVQVACETCPRAYHLRCLKQTIVDPEHWPCPECVSILKAENTQTRSKAMKGMTLEHLCSLLKFAVKRMIQCNGSEPFIHPVDETQFPEYRNYIIQPMTLTMLEKNIKDNAYGSTQAFEADAKWILHNSIIFNSYQSKLTSAAKTIVKICKQEMAEIENCSSCYLNANTKKHTWFVEVCPKPHLLVWAKLKGFPYWPAKVMSINSSGMADVRFFGAHDKAWVSVKDCFLYSVKDPNSGKQKRNDIIECVKELELYVDNLREIYGRVNFAPFKTPLEPDSQLKQLQVFLPNYRDDGREMIARKAKEGRNEKSLNKSVVEETDGEESEDSSEEEDEDEGDEREEEEEEEDDDDRGKKKADEKSNGDKHKEGMTRVDYRDKPIGKPKIIAKPIKAIIVRKRYLSDSSQDSLIKVARRDLNKTSTPRLSVDNHVKDEETPKETNNIEKDAEEKKDTANISPPTKLRISDELIKKLVDLDKNEIEEEKPTEAMDVDNETKTDDAESKTTLVETTEEVTLKKDEEKKDAIENKKVEEKMEEEVQINEIEKEEKQSEDKVEEPTLEKTEEKPQEPEQPVDKSVIEEEKSEPEKVSVSKTAEPETRKANHTSANEASTKPAEKIKEKERVTRKRKHEEAKNEKSKPKEPPKDATVFPPNKMVKLVPIENILQKKTPPEPSPKKSEQQLIVLKEIRVVKDGKEVRNRTKKPEPTKDKDRDATPVTIKSEVESDEDTDVQYMEAKRKYLSALNISEKQKLPNKPKAHEIRTRSKTEEKKSKKEEAPKADSLAKEAPKSAEPAKEIYVKSLAKMQTAKHKARKSFPTPNYGKKTIVARKLIPKSPLDDELTLVNATTLQPAANVMILPKLHYTKPPTTRNLSSPPVLTMLPRPSLEQGAAGKRAADGSQNYIPQNEDEASRAAKAAGGPILLNNLLSAGSSTTAQSALEADSAPPTSALDAELNALKEMLPDGLRKGVTELLCQPPPKLRPRPVGILNSVVEAGVPSTAGPVASRINSMAQKLGDYFRSLLVETISDIGKANNPEATISSLKYEIEELNHKHTIELAEIRRNVSIVLKDIQKSVVEERERIVNETKANCEMEMMKKVEEAKSKQWCANCSKEAQFYCCWNTSYCDYPCQQKHWPKHMSKCTQTSSGPSQTTPSPARTTTGQQLLLTPTAAPKFGTLFPKPQKVYLKRTNIPFKPTTGSHITLVESTPGNFELLGSGPIAVNGKILASTSVLEKIKSGGSNVVTVTAPSSTTNTQLASAQQKVNPVPKSTVNSTADSEH